MFFCETLQSLTASFRIQTEYRRVCTGRGEDKSGAGNDWSLNYSGAACPESETMSEYLLPTVSTKVDSGARRLGPKNVRGLPSTDDTCGTCCQSVRRLNPEPRRIMGRADSNPWGDVHVNAFASTGKASRKKRYCKVAKMHSEGLIPGAVA